MQVQLFSDKISSQQLLQVLPAALYTCDTSGYIQWFNPAAAELWGRKPVIGEELWCGSWRIYKPDGTLLSPGDCPMAIALRTRQKVEGAEIIIEKPNGERRNIMPYPKPIFDVSGEMVGAINMLIDITETKRSEREMARLAAIVESSDDAIISKTLNGTITSWNPGAEKLFGFTAGEMIGQQITRLIPEDRLNEEQFIIDRISQGELVDHFHTLRQTKNRGLIDISLTISPIKDKSGRVIGASKIARDITRSRIEEEKLRQSEKNLNELANAMPQLVWITDADGIVTYFNDRIDEYSQGNNLTGKTYWQNLVHPDDFPATNTAWKKAFSNGEIFQQEHRFCMAEGKSCWHLTRIIPYHDNNGAISKWIGTATDIDDMKLAAIRKDDFLSVASHELRTPITSIKAYSQLLLETYGNSDDNFLKNALTKLEVQSNKMTKLVTDFLKLSKIESGKLQLTKTRFKINDLVSEIAAEIQFVSVNHRIRIEELGTAEVLADRERISQVIANFLNNAIKYSPGTDEVIVTIEPSGNTVRVLVKDKGIGVKPEDHKKIFERFYRAKSNGNIPFSGFGIGLYISAELIRRHEGEIGVNSEEGKGSTFYFALPVAE